MKTNLPKLEQYGETLDKLKKDILNLPKSTKHQQLTPIKIRKTSEFENLKTKMQESSIDMQRIKNNMRKIQTPSFFEARARKFPKI